MLITPFFTSFTSRTIPGLIGLFFFFAAVDRVSFGQTGVPRLVEAFTEVKLGRKPLNSCGSLEGSIQAMRAYRPLDLIAMAAPKACMVVGETEDLLFPPLGQKEATRQIGEAFNWAGSPDLFRSYAPAKPHCYDEDIQEEALAWFNKHLKAGKK